MENKQVDYLENDNPIPGQNYTCLSFISPENTLKDKQLFEMYQYFSSQYPDIINKLSFEHVSENFEKFKDEHKTRIDKEFKNKYGFQTSIRGLKIRGVYDTLEEAQFRAKRLQQRDPQFNVFVGQVGFWLPWDPNPLSISNQEYANDQLNELMK